MTTRSSYRRLSDLYVRGKELVLADGTVMWLQAMNAFERQEATSDAAAARSRLVLALNDDPDGNEAAIMRAQYTETGREDIINLMMESTSFEAYLEIIDELRADEKWREKIDVIERSPDLAQVATDLERDYLMRLMDEYATEIGSRLDVITSIDRQEMEGMSDDALWEKYRTWWIEQRGNMVGMFEYRMTQLWYACRICSAVKKDGGWDHGSCDHRVRVFEEKDEIRHLPEDLQEVIATALAGLEMTEREGKS